MRRTVLVGLFALFAVCAANNASAQRGGGGGHASAGGSYGFAGGGHGFSGARPAYGRGGDGFNHGGGFAHRGFHHDNQGFGNGFGYPGYGLGFAALPYDDGYMPFDSDYEPLEPPQPMVYIPPGPQVIPASAPPAAQPPAHPVVTEYKWPATETAAVPSETEAQNFAIVLKDGESFSAVAVYASNNWLHYVDPDDRHLRIPMREVDRTATLKLNRERSLSLYLPAAE
jgi:hypothetical protein